MTCGWVVACRDDDSVAPPTKAPTVPNTPLVPVPIPGLEPDASDDFDDVPTSSLTIAADIDPTLSADEWKIKATVVDGTLSDPTSSTFRDHSGEATVQRTFATDALVQIEIYGRTVLSDGTEYIIGHRLATTHFVPREHRLVYLFIDQNCAYDTGGSNDGGTSCPNAGDWCSEGKCRAQEIAVDTLPVYRSDWRQHPPSPCGANAPVLQLGEGYAAFEERQDGDTVTIECGPQGGHHIWLAARTQGLDQRNPLLTITAPASDAGAPLITSFLLGRLYPSTDPLAATFCDATGIQFQLDPDGRPVQAYLGRPLDITFTVQDRNGQKVQLTRHVQVAPKLSTASCF